MRNLFGPKTASLLCLHIFLLVCMHCAADAQTILVPAGAEWKYLDNGSDQGTAWVAAGFNDSTWPSGPAPLGYGNGDEATVVSFGPDPNHKYVTTYFRHYFEVTDPSGYGGLLLRLLRDDGAVAYLNGIEVCRSNMPAGPISYLTPASSAVGSAGEYTFYNYSVDPVFLQPGVNVLAVEIHQSSVTSSDIRFDLELATTYMFRKAPYLTFGGNASEMTVHWQLYTSHPCEISWGPDTLYSMGNAVTSEYGADHQHSFSITNLAPSTRHYYRVAAGEDTLSGSFRSAPPAAADSLKFFAYGDSRTYPLDHEQVASAMVAAFGQDSSFQTLVLSIGDLVGNGNEESGWDAELFNPDYPGITTLLADLPYQVAMGNHDGSGLLFSKYFPYPFVGGRYWSFDYGPAHFVMMDQYSPYGPGSPQLAWVESDLASTNKPWRFICLHEPGWSAGGGHANDATVQEYIQPLCEVYGVAAVIGGHNHYYARAEVNGVEHITTGGGGAPLYEPDTTFPGIVAARRAYHYCELQIDRNILTFKALTPDGEVIDEFTLAQTPISAGQPGAGTNIGVSRRQALSLRLTYPNPFSAWVRLSFFLEDSARVTLRVFNVEGRLVRTLAAENLGPGDHALNWNGLDDRGRPAAPGVYVCRLEADGLNSSSRVVFLR